MKKGKKKHIMFPLGYLSLGILIPWETSPLGDFSLGILIPWETYPLGDFSLGILIPCFQRSEYPMKSPMRSLYPLLRILLFSKSTKKIWISLGCWEASSLNLRFYKKRREEASLFPWAFCFKKRKGKQGRRRFIQKRDTRYLEGIRPSLQKKASKGQKKYAKLFFFPSHTSFVPSKPYRRF